METVKMGESLNGPASIEPIHFAPFLRLSEMKNLSSVLFGNQSLKENPFLGVELTPHIQPFNGYKVLR